MEKQTVGVIFGSRSAEHDVSIVTAIAAIINPLKRSNKYNVIPIYISKDGSWYADEKLGDIRLYSTGQIEQFLQKVKPVSLSFTNGLSLITLGLKNKETKIDIAFPATHGTYGEDGSLMGVLRMANAPFVGCDLAASAVAMDKVLSKQIAEYENTPVTPWVWCSKADYAQRKDEITQQINQLQYPLFVKPAHLGSSIGITRIKAPGELDNALEVALHYDDKALVEQAVNNLIEVTVPVIGNETPRPGLVERPLSLTDEGVFDFETKYIGQGKAKGGKMAGAKQGAQGYSELPAKLDPKLYKQCEQTALNVYKALGCSGIARVDLLIDSKTNKVYFNEINPLPGSLYFHNWRAAGTSPLQLAEELLELAQDRHKKQQTLNTTFSTNFLKQF